MFQPFLKKHFSLFIVLLNLTIAKAQLGKEAWHWQFGDYCSLDFSSGVPFANTYDSTNVDEGTASISDINTGQLLFYTDGTSAWDRNNHRMPNGYGMIGGQGTSTQAALIVPKPGSSTIYYLVSADQGGYCCGIPPNANQGVHYSVVDMSLNGGLGDVVSGSKNILLTPPPTTEKLTAIKHCNDRDYWVITHPFNSNTFNAYLITPSGINTTPIASKVGVVQSNISGTYYETVGYLKASPNGKRLACAVQYMKLLELFDFDNSTGIVSNPISLSVIQPSQSAPDTVGAYGVCFSPDNSKLYVTSGSSSNILLQYDLTSGISSTINSSVKNIAQNYGQAGALQLAPNDKIYITSNTPFLQEIDNPNDTSLSCHYQYYGTSFFCPSSCPMGVISIFGLPNFIDANTIVPSSNVTTVSLCNFTSYTLTTQANSPLIWSNGDTTQSININTFEDYWVSYLNSQGCKEVDTFHITVAQAPVINILQDSMECGTIFSPLTIDATYTNTASYLWNDGFTSPVHTLKAPGKYEVSYTFSNDCVSKDSFTLFLISYPVINLGDDTAFCSGTKYADAYYPSSTYLWNSGATSQGISITQPGTYWVQVNHSGCIKSDTLMVVPNRKQLDFIMPNIVTPNNDGINDFIDFGTFQFSSLQLEIYNRWGNKVFESTDPACIWKPTEQDGTYYYILQYYIDCGTESQNKAVKGYITLIR